MDILKLYAFVDETGQDTYGRFFLVCVVVLEQSVKDALELVLEEIEKRSTKNKLKWKSSDTKTKKAFIQEIVKIKELKQSLFYSIYKDTKKYHDLTALTIQKVMYVVAKEEYSTLIVIDGLSKADTIKMKRDIKALGVKFWNIRGMKDEQSVFLRLADAMAGFVRDYLEGDKYTKGIYEDLVKRGFLQEV